METDTEPPLDMVDMEPSVKRQKVVWKNYCEVCFFPFSRTDSLARHRTNRVCTTKEAPKKDPGSQPALQKGIICDDDLLQGASLIPNVSARFKILQKMGVFSKKFYPLVFFDEPEKAPEELAEIFPITDSAEILSEVIKGSVDGYVKLYTNVKVYYGNVCYDLSKFCVPKENEFEIEHCDKFVKVKLKQIDDSVIVEINDPISDSVIDEIDDPISDSVINEIDDPMSCPSPNLQTENQEISRDISVTMPSKVGKELDQVQKNPVVYDFSKYLVAQNADVNDNVDLPGDGGIGRTGGGDGDNGGGGGGNPGPGRGNPGPGRGGGGGGGGGGGATSFWGRRGN